MLDREKYRIKLHDDKIDQTLSRIQALNAITAKDLDKVF